MMREPTQAELQAYVDGQLEPERRVAVTAYLSGRGEEAAGVMADSRQREEIRQWLAGPQPPLLPETDALARSFGRQIRRRQWGPPLRRAAAMAAMVLAGWFGHAYLAAPYGRLGQEPEAVLADDAAQTWRVIKLAAGAPSSRPGADAVQVVRQDQIAWEGGTAKLELLATSSGEEVVLLSAPVDLAGEDGLEVATHRGVTTVAWRDDGQAFALSGDLPADDLLHLARRILRRS